MITYELGQQEIKKKQYVETRYCNDVEYSDIGRVKEYFPQSRCQDGKFYSLRENLSSTGQYEYYDKLTKVYETSKFVTDGKPKFNWVGASIHFGRYSNLQYFHSSTITHTSGQNALMFGPSTIEVDMPNLLSVELDFYDARNIEKLNLPKLRHLGPFNFYKLRNKEYALPSLEEIVSYNFEQLYDTTLYLRSLKVIATGELRLAWSIKLTHLPWGDASADRRLQQNIQFWNHDTRPEGSLKKYQEDPTWILCQSVRGFTLVEEEE